MIKVFIPEIKRKYNKPSARGFWRENGKTYYDYIKIKEYAQSINGLYYSDLFNKYLENLKLGYKQEAIFFVNGNVGNVYYSKDKTVILPHREVKEVSRTDLKKAIRTALNDYSGCTVYQNNGRYYIEIFTII